MPNPDVGTKEELITELSQYCALLERMLLSARHIETEALRLDRVSEINNILCSIKGNLGWLSTEKNVSQDDVKDIADELNGSRVRIRELIGKPDSGGQHTKLRVLNGLRGEG